MPTLNTELQTKCVNTIRTLSIDAIQKANSGHPGMPMGCAPIAHLLYSKILKHNPANPKWLNRDRFILSAGHGSMLLYSSLHLAGYDVTLDDIKNFRQWKSKTPGHPEVNETPGVETTTGPLGQGIVNAVGMSVAYAHLAERYNKDDIKLLDHFIYAITSDGEIMEGISHEASSFAGHNKLGNLILFYDDNNISIEGNVTITMSEDVVARYEAYGWQVQIVEDVNDLEALETAVLEAQRDERPSIIITKTHIGYGSPNKQDTSASHGSPLGTEEIELTKENLGFPKDKHFFIPEEVAEFYSSVKTAGEKKEEEWNKVFHQYKDKYPKEAEEFFNILNGEFGSEWFDAVPEFKPEDGKIATRAASGKVINAIAELLPTLLGGSADLAGSNNTQIKNSKSFSSENYLGRNFHFGVREQSMAAILNGMALYGGLIPYGGTFLVFMDYMKSPMRMAALMEQKVIFVLTHDSIGLGEDGPTHQPVEHLMNLRSIPNLVMIRPADANETAEAWKFAIQHNDGPVALCLTRQGLPILEADKVKYASRGAYILRDTEKTPDVILMATGSEVELTMKAADKLAEEKIEARVVSLPSWEIFEKQSEDYKETILPKNVKARVSVEAGIKMGWERFLGFEGEAVSLNHFGASAPANILFEKFGFTVDNVVEKAKKTIERNK